MYEVNRCGLCSRGEGEHAALEELGQINHRYSKDGNLEQIDRSCRHHAAPAEKVVGAPVEVLKREAHIVLFGDALEDAFRLRNDFLADTVAGNHADRKLLQVFDVIVTWRSQRPEESGGTA